MRIDHLSIGIAALIILMISGCISGSVTETQNAPEAPDTVQSAAVPEVQEPVQNVEPAEEVRAETVPDGFVAEVTGIVTEKDVYHSNEVMKFTVTVYANGDLPGVDAKATGISGRMNLNQIVNLTAGENEMEFETRLPSCNRCSGISPGMHDIVVQLYYGDLIAENSTKVEIQQ